MEERVPRFSYDLIVQLDKDTPRPEFPDSQASWSKMNEEWVRKQTWIAAQRAIVDELMERLQYDEHGD